MMPGEDQTRHGTEVVEGRHVRFSPIIATKGRPASLRDALESSARGLPHDGEVIVVDGDPEHSAESVVRGVGDRYPDMDIRHVASDPGAASSALLWVLPSSWHRRSVSSRQDRMPCIGG